MVVDRQQKQLICLINMATINFDLLELAFKKGVLTKDNQFLAPLFHPSIQQALSLLNELKASPKNRDQLEKKLNLSSNTVRLYLQFFQKKKLVIKSKSENNSYLYFYQNSLNPIKPFCRRCGSPHTYKNGHTQSGKQLYCCRDCNYSFTPESNYKK